MNLTSNHVEKWTRIQASRAGPSEVARANIYVWIEGGNADILVDCVQMEDGPPTTFTNGIRADEGLRLPGAGVLDNKQGTVEFDLLVNDSYRNTEEMCLFSFADPGFYQGNPYWGMNSIRLFRYDGEFMLWSNSYWSAGNVSQGLCSGQPFGRLAQVCYPLAGDRTGAFRGRGKGYLGIQSKPSHLCP